MYVTVTLRGVPCDISYRVIEDDPSTNAFEVDWHFTDPPPFADELTEAEHETILTTIAEAAYDRDDYPEDDVRN